MSSLRRILSSRANGARSQGPKTLEGPKPPEATPRSAINALRHGLLSDCVVLPGESREAFGALLSQHLERLDPHDGVEFGMIEELAASYWRMRRAWAIENHLLAEGMATQSAGDDVARIAASFRQLASSPELALLHRYETRLHLMYQRALHNLLLLRTAGVPNEPNPISGHPAAPLPKEKPNEKDVVPIEEVPTGEITTAQHPGIPLAPMESLPQTASVSLLGPASRQPPTPLANRMASAAKRGMRAVKGAVQPAAGAKHSDGYTMNRMNRAAKLVVFAAARLAVVWAQVAFAQLPPGTAGAPATLPGTQPLQMSGDLAAQMVDSINAYLLQRTAAQSTQTAANRQPIAASRDAFRKIIGATDARVPFGDLELTATLAAPAAIGEGDGYQVFAVRWPVFEGVTGEGLLLRPRGRPVERVVAVPDADWSPEMLTGLAAGVPPQSQFARRLAESGCEVVVPLLIDRQDTWSGVPGIAMTNQTHREFLYRMAFEVGRHIIGYEVQKILAVIDWFERANGGSANGGGNGRAGSGAAKIPVAVAGYGEGGLLALYAAALDTRIDGVLVSGYFQSRQNLWQEPIYRDVWGLLKGFGDAELARLIAPRVLIVEASRGPRVNGPPPESSGRRGGAPNGRLVTPPLESVQSEVNRAREFFAPGGQNGGGAAGHLKLVASEQGRGDPGSGEALSALLGGLLGSKASLAAQGKPPVNRLSKLDATPPDATPLDASARMHRQFQELIDFTQKLIRQSPARRAEFWSKADASSPERWVASTAYYKDHIWSEVIGRMPAPSIPANPRTRLIYDEPKFLGYEVVLDTWPGIFAYGILLVPKGLKPGERRPVVVCQHGLEGRPSEVVDPKVDNHYYHSFGARLAEEGFITFSPQNPYIGDDRFRIIQRKGHPLKLSLFSFILGQHQRTLEWLAALPFVDAGRIGFYGLSYGGKTAVRVPPLLDRYALSICSADFNEWVWKTTSLDNRYSYMFTKEYDMLEFNFANVVNYSELASLMAPRPFMVERGHSDTVAADETVAYEYAKVRRFYESTMHLPDRTRIEFFNGPHTINGQGTFQFLREHLHWPK